MTDERMAPRDPIVAMDDDAFAPARWLAGVGRKLHRAPGLSATLQEIVEIAQAETGADAALLIEPDPRRESARVLAATDHDLAAWLVALRPTTTNGPGRQSLRQGELIRVDDLGTETRWPAYTAEIVASTPIRSVLAACLTSRDGAPVAALIVYGYRPGAFDCPTTERLTLLAEQASIALEQATEADRTHNLELALQTARDIGAAVGILMERYSEDRAAAFRRLSRLSQDANRKLRQVAAELVGQAGDTPRPG